MPKRQEEEEEAFTRTPGPLWVGEEGGRGRGLAGVGRTAGGPGEHKGGALWQRCRFWGA